MKIVGVTFTCNEAKLIPYVMPYWEKLGVDKLIVYDNNSNDGTFETLIKHPLTEVRLFSTGGEFNEYALTYLRNNGWKDIDADWIIVADFDEVPFCETDIREYLANNDATIVQTHQFNLVRKDLPELDGALLHQLPDNEFNDMGIRYDKCHTFRPASVKEIGYALGMHSINPQGDIKIVRYPEEFYFIHLKYIEDYTAQKAAMYYDRLPEDIKLGGCINWHIKILRDEYKEALEKYVSPRYPNLEELKKNLKR